MKKMLLVLCAAALMLIPMSSMAAMTSISDSEMEAVTGQMGISIGVIAEVDVVVDNLSYGDTDIGAIHVLGATTGTIGHNAGYVNVDVGTISVRTGFRDITGDASYNVESSITKPITIDVLTESNIGNPLAVALGVTGETIVRIGLPDMQLIADVGQIQIGLTAAANTPIASGNSLGVLEIGSLILDTYSELQSDVGVHTAGTPCQVLLWAH